MSAPEPYTLLVDVERFLVHEVAAAVDAVQGAVHARRFLAVLGQPEDGRIRMRLACGVVTRLSWHGAAGKPTRISADIELLDTEAGHAAEALLKTGRASMGLVGRGKRTHDLTLSGVAVLPPPEYELRTNESVSCARCGTCYTKAVGGKGSCPVCSCTTTRAGREPLVGLDDETPAPWEANPDAWKD